LLLLRLRRVDLPRTLGVAVEVLVVMSSMVAVLPLLPLLSALPAVCGQVGLALLLLLGIECRLDLCIGGSQDVLCESGRDAAERLAGVVDVVPVLGGHGLNS